MQNQAVVGTGNTRLFYHAVAPHVARVLGVDTKQFRVISRSVKKTGERDAALLALYLSKGLLPEVRMKDKQHGQLASLTQTRDTLVKLRTALKNKVNNILPARGIKLAKEALSSEKKLAEVLALPFDEIVPRVSNSNQTEHSGRIHKRGTKLGWTALVQSALIAANYSPYLKNFYERVKARRGTGKAIIVLAGKFLGIIYRTLKNKWVFEDFPNFVLEEGA